MNPTINMNMIPDALTSTRRLPRPSCRRGEVRRLVPAASGRFGLPASPWVHLVLWRRPASWALLIARPARGGCCADSLSCILVSCSRIRREQDQLPRCSRGSPGSGHGSCASLVPTRELVGISTFLLLLKKKISTFLLGPLWIFLFRRN